MSLFGYYAWHSLKNQLKKLFKTWVLIFILVCMLFGGIIGGGIAKLSDMAEENDPGTQIEEEAPDFGPEEERDPALVASITEAVAGVAILGLLILFIKGADKNGSAIFLPADVTLLFTAPMKPQAVLTFRTMCTIGLVLVSSVYLIFQIPNLMINLQFTIWEALSLLLAWFFVFLFGQLIKICLYTVCSTSAKLKKYITPVLLGIAGAAVAGYIIYSKTCGMDGGDAFLSYMNTPISRYIPIWGWTKGIVGSAFDGSRPDRWRRGRRPCRALRSRPPSGRRDPRPPACRGRS